METPLKAPLSLVPPGGLLHLMRLKNITADADAEAHCDAVRISGRLAGRDNRRNSLFRVMRARTCERGQIL